MHKIFTIDGGRVTDGATVVRHRLSGGTEIAAIVIGEEGRGRYLGILPVDALPQDNWTLHCASLVQTRNGWSILVSDTSCDDDYAIVVLRTPIGFRGGNDHTGDRVDIGYAAFPGRILTDGQIAQGDAGRMGSGQQIIALMPKGVVFRTGYSGRLYGAPEEHYYVYDGVSIRVATWEERQVTGYFDDAVMEGGK